MPLSAHLRDLAFMDLYIRLDVMGEARFHTSSRDHTNDWTDALPEKYRREVEVIATDLRTHMEHPDSSYSYDGMRFRVSYQKLSNGQDWVALRRISARVPAIDELTFAPSIVTNLLRQIGRRKGLVLISGPTGHGKTTTAFSLLNYYLSQYGGTGITIEDPTEYLLDGPVGDHGYCYQVQVGHDDDWVTPLKNALRWTPRYLLVGEVRTGRAAEQILRAATTGHLVITTIHAGSVEESLMGLIHLAEREMGNQGAHYMLAQAITACLHQTLSSSGPFIRWVTTDEGNNGDPIRALIREHKVGAINTYIDQQVARMRKLGMDAKA